MLEATRDFKPFIPRVPRPLREGTNPLVLAYRFARNPITIWADFQFEAARHTFSYFNKPAVLLNDPDEIYRVFSRNSSDMELEPVRQRVMRPVFGDGVVSSEGALWKEGRRITAQTLARVPIARMAQASLDATERALATQHTERVQASALTDGMTIDIASATLFDGTLMPIAGDYVTARDGYLGSIGSALMAQILSVPDWMPFPGRAVARRHMAGFRSFGQALSEAASRKPESAYAYMAAAHREAGLSEEVLLDNTLTIIAASQESLSQSATWALFLMSRDAHAQARAQAEIDAAGLDQLSPENWPAALPFVTACYNEGLRLYPSLPVLSRVALTDIPLEDGMISAGSVVFLNLWVLHRHKKLWRNPAAFEPGRFLPGRVEEIPKRAYIPFGTGSRACIGHRVAALQGVVILAAILRARNLTYAGRRDPTPIMRITLQPDNGVPIEMTGRRG